MSEREPFSFDGYAVIEFMGHRKRAGKVKTAEIGGTAVFIVESETKYADGGKMSEVYAASALYAMTPCSEDVARRVGSQINPAPLSEYDLPSDWRDAIRDLERQKRDQAQALEAGEDSGSDAGFLDDPDFDEDPG